jgi:hypothetical protein
MKKDIIVEISRIKEMMGLISEQQQPSFGSKEQTKVSTKTSTESLKIDVGSNNFEQGKYKFTSLSPESQEKIKTGLENIARFLKENPNAKVTINLEVGESAVTNYDREKCPPKEYTDRCRMEPGALAKARAQTLVNYLNEIFDSYVTNGIIKTKPIIPQPKTNVELGTQKHKYDRTKEEDRKNANDPKYKEDQYIKFDISVESIKTEDVYEDTCLIDFEIDVSYYKKYDSKFPCRGGHQCNQAKFQVFINETLIGVADLNNGSGKDVGGDRVAKLKVTPDLVEQIMKGYYFQDNERLVLFTKCMSNNCHTSTQEVKLSNKKGEILYHQCVNPKADRGNKENKILAVMDKCGNVIQNYTATKEEMDKLVDTEKMVSRYGGVEGYENYKSEEKQDFVEKVENTESTVIFPNPVLFDIVSDKSVMKVIGNKLEGSILLLNVKNNSEEGYSVKLGVDRVSEMYVIKPGQELKTNVRYKEIKVNEQRKDKFLNVLSTLYGEGKDREIIQITEGPFRGYYFFKQGTQKKQISFTQKVEGVIPDNEVADGYTVVDSNSLIKVTYIGSK